MSSPLSIVIYAPYLLRILSNSMGKRSSPAYRVCLFGRAASLDNGSVLQASGERTALSSEKIGIRVTAGRYLLYEEIVAVREVESEVC